MSILGLQPSSQTVEALRAPEQCCCHSGHSIDSRSSASQQQHAQQRLWPISKGKQPCMLGYCTPPPLLQNVLLLPSNASIDVWGCRQTYVLKVQAISVWHTCFLSTPVLCELRNLCSFQSMCCLGQVGQGCILSQAVRLSSPSMGSLGQLQDASLIDCGVRHLWLS